MNLESGRDMAEAGIHPWDRGRRVSKDFTEAGAFELGFEGRIGVVQVGILLWRDMPKLK